MRQGIKILGLTMLTALSMMAVTATAAHAAEGELKVGGKVLGAGLEEEFKGTGGEGKLLVPGIGLTVKCGNSTIEKTKGGNLTALHVLLLILFHVCVVEKSEKTCLVYPTDADRTAKTNAGLIHVHALGLVIKVGSVYYLKITPLEGNLFTKLFLSKGTCTLPSENEITGSAAVKIDTPNTESASHELLPITEAEEKEKGIEVALKYGAEAARVDGNSGKVELVSGGLFSLT